MSNPAGEERRTGTADNGKPFESVWDYPRPPRLESVDHRITVIHGGVTIADSSACMRVLETSQPPAYYLPSADIDMERLRPSATITFCEWKGVSAYAHIVPDPNRPAGVASDGAWTYPTPTGDFASLAGYWAFYAQKIDECLVDGERVESNAGSFYGGWVTANITGPFKGAPGTSHW